MNAATTVASTDTATAYRGFYFEIVACMMALLLVVLPVAVFLQIYCAGAKGC